MFKNIYHLGLKHHRRQTKAECVLMGTEDGPGHIGADVWASGFSADLP